MKNIKLNMSHWGWVVPLILISTFLMAHHLTTDTYWGDEVANLRKMGIPPYEPATIIDMIYLLGVTQWPPAYNLFLLPWGGLLGWTEYGTRVFSLLLGVLTLATTYRFVGRTFDKQIAIIATLLLGTSVYFAFYGHEMRGYMLYMFLTVSTLYLYWEYIYCNHSSRIVPILFVISGIILTYTHYVALFVMAGIGLYHLIFSRHTARWKPGIMAFVVIGIAYLPWIGVAILTVVDEISDQRGLDAISIVQTMFFSYSNSLWFLFIPLLILSFNVRHQARTMLWVVGIVLLIGALLLNAVSDFLFNIRHIIGLLPIAMILTALSIAYIGRHISWLSIVIVVVWSALGVYLSRDLQFMDSLPGGLINLPMETMNLNIQTLDQCRTDGDAIITHLTQEYAAWHEKETAYYLWQPEQRLALLDFMSPITTEQIEIDVAPTYEERLITFIDDVQRVWILVAPYAYETPLIETVSNKLADSYSYCGQVINHPMLRAYVYQNTPEFTCNHNNIKAQTFTTCAPDLLIDSTQKPD